MPGRRYIELARRLTPPLLWEALARGARRLGPPPEWRYLPGGWPDDWRGPGWEDPSVAEKQREGWAAFCALLAGAGPLGISHEAPRPTARDLAAHNTVMSFAYALCLAARGKKSLSILDWGGGLGQYLLLARALLPDLDLEYHCKDLPGMCRLGKELLPEGRFYEHSEDCLQRSYDLVLASSSLQYSRDWKGVLRGLADATTGHLFVTRTPVVQSVPSFVVVQRPHAHGYNTEYPGWFLNQAELLESAGSRGLRLVREFIIAEQPLVASAPEQAGYRGFLFSR